jgi:hypothetical protein
MRNHPGTNPLVLTEVGIEDEDGEAEQSDDDCPAARY